MKKFKKYYPYITAVVLFIIVPMIYFAPQYTGKDIRKFDNVQAKGMTTPIIEHINEYDEHPYWAANMFGGMPSYAIHTEHTFDIFKDSGAFLRKSIGEPASFYMILMLGFFVMLLCFGVNPWIAIVGSIAYGLSTYFIIIYEAGHIMKLVALGYTAPLVGALYYTYRKSMWVGAPLFGVFTLLITAAVHPQITYYFIIAMLCMVIAFAVQAYKNKSIKSFILSSVALLVTSSLAIGANSIYLYYTNDYTSESTRGKAILSTNSESSSGGLDKDYITAWSYGKMETFNLFIPNLMGGKSNGGFSGDGAVAESLEKYVGKSEATKIAKQLPGYWGPQPMTSGPVYIGAVMIFLFVLGLFIIRGVNLWWIVGATSISILLAWGKNFMPLTDLFIDYFPLYNKFRTVSMILVVVELTVPLMAMLVLADIYKGKVGAEKLKKSLLNSLYICGGVAIAFILFGSMIFSFSGLSDAQMGLPADVIEALAKERALMMRADAVRSLAFVALTFGVVWWWSRGKLKSHLALIALIALVTFDMVPIAARHINYSMFETNSEKADTTPMSGIDKEILKDSDINYRVANLSVSTFNDATTSTYHRSIGGYFAAKPRRYQDMIDRYLSKMNIGVYNMLNTKYFIIPDSNGRPQLQTNPEAYGNAWVASDIELVDTPNREIEAVGEVELSSTAVVNREFEDMLSNVVFERSINDVITHTKYKANSMEYKVNLSDNRLIVFSEVYYPKGWKAYIDGKEVPYLRANYILNALVVPAGEHTILFEFEPPRIATLKTITTVSSLLLLLLLAAGVYINYKKKRN